jgi:hypothetical protein
MPILLLLHRLLRLLHRLCRLLHRPIEHRLVHLIPRQGPAGFLGGRRFPWFGPGRLS